MLFYSTRIKHCSLRLCSHDAGTGRKRHEKVTFSLSVHTMPVRNCTIPSLLPSKQCRFPNGMRWKRNALRYRVNTENGTFLYRFSTQLSTLKLFDLFTLWHKIYYSNSIVKMANLIYYLRT